VIRENSFSLCKFVTFMTKVLVFGTFDGLHEGHLNFFRQARNISNLDNRAKLTTGQVFLIVVVARDSTVLRIKKHTPKYNENERLKSLLTNSHELVNDALFGVENHDPNNNSYEIIKEIKPDIICLGYDQAQFEDKLKAELKRMDLNYVKVAVLKPYKSEIYKSSLLNSLK